MQAHRIAKLLEPFLGTDIQPPSEREALYQHVSTYIDILLRWNARINLTAIRDPEEIVTRHFGESLFAARHLFAKIYPASSESCVFGDFGSSNAASPPPHPRIADLGSGAGFPGIPMKLLCPGVSVTLIESSHKKATFLREVVRTLELTDVKIENNRGENLQTTFDLVTLRAVERFAFALRAAASLVAKPGHLALLISLRQFDTVQKALLGFTWDAPIPIPLSEQRILVTGRRLE